MASALDSGHSAAARQQQPIIATSFPRFSALPPEIRLQVWRVFAPVGPRRSPQVLPFKILPSSQDRKGRRPPRVIPCPSLVNQMANVRAVSSVHRESRAEAVRAFPHTLTLIGGEIVVRFHRELDVVLLDTVIGPGLDHNLEGWGHDGIWGFTGEIRQVAIGPNYFNNFRLQIGTPTWLMRFLKVFTRLAVVYYTLEACVLEDESCSWCISTEVNHFYKPEIQGTGRVNQLEVVYCWPNLVRNRQYIQQQSLLWENDYSQSHRLEDFMHMMYGTMLPTEFPHTGPEKSTYLEDDAARRLEQVEFWPMVAFSGFYCLRRYRSLGGVDVEKHPDDSDSE